MIPGQISVAVAADDINDVRTLTILPGLSHPTVRQDVVQREDLVQPEDIDQPETEATIHIDLTVDPPEMEIVPPLRRESESDPFGPGDMWDVKRRSDFITQLDDRLHSGKPVAMVAIGLDRFHALNLAQGVEAGDAAIRNAHRVLRWTLGPSNVAYFGSDCFAAVLPYGGKPTTEVLDAALDQLACTDLSDDLSGTFATASAGMIVIEDRDTTVDVVLDEAQRLMLMAKEMGGNGAVVDDLPGRSVGAISA